MPTPIEAARTAVDELMEVAAALAFHEWPDGDTKKQVQLVLTKARTAGAALEAITAGTEPFEQRDAERTQSNRLRSPAVPIEPSQEAELFPNQKPSGRAVEERKVGESAAYKSPGSAVSYGTVNPPKKERGGPKDADRAPTEFKGEFSQAGQIHPVANFHHCELCGMRLDLERLDPCRINECPHPRPQDQRA